MSEQRRMPENPVGAPSPPITTLARFRRALSPRRNLTARLLLGFFLAFFIPGALIVFILVRRLTELKNNSIQQVRALRRAGSSMQIRQDASFRAEWIDRRAAVAEEAAWSLATAASVALSSPSAEGRIPSPFLDAHGHVWNPKPVVDTVAVIDLHKRDPKALRDYARKIGR